MNTEARSTSNDPSPRSRLSGGALSLAYALFSFAVIECLLTWGAWFPAGWFEGLAQLCAFLASLLAFGPLLFGSILEARRWPKRLPWTKALFLTGMSFPLWFLARTLDTPSRAIRTADPVARAVQRFVSEKGHPPGSLAELVPTYLDGVPTTLTRTFRELSYERSDRHEMGWELSFYGESLLAGWAQVYFDPDHMLDYEGRAKFHRLEDWCGFMKPRPRPNW